MLMDGPSATKEGAGKPQAPPRTRRWRRSIVVLLSLAIFGGIALAGGFVWFVDRVPTQEIKLDRKADGIVVLTGRAARIAEAVELLATGHGKRLLITGVYPTTTAAAIARLTPEHREWFKCCVELDHSAVNTVGNAKQTRVWAKKYGVKSLIVVTSNYHMPRTMVELSHQLPDVEIIAYPIAPDWVRSDSWWSNFSATRLLFAEYLKYLRAVVRTQSAYVLTRPSDD